MAPSSSDTGHTKVPIFPFFLVATALCLALLDFPITYYYLLRLGVVGCAAYGFVAFTQLRIWGFRWLFLPVALPFAFMTMRRDEWAPIDLLVAAFFGIAGGAAGLCRWFFARKARPTSPSS